jgi:hypothetical protein
MKQQTALAVLFLVALHAAMPVVSGQRALVTAALPPHTCAWFVNVRSGGLTASFDFNQSNR